MEVKFDSTVLSINSDCTVIIARDKITFITCESELGGGITFEINDNNRTSLRHMLWVCNHPSRYNTVMVLQDLKCTKGTEYGLDVIIFQYFSKILFNIEKGMVEDIKSFSFVKYVSMEEVSNMMHVLRVVED